MMCGRTVAAATAAGRPYLTLGVSPQTRTDRTDIGTLFIQDVKVSDAGTYLCVGNNGVRSNSAPIEVVVLKGEQANTNCLLKIDFLGVINQGQGHLGVTRVFMLPVPV